MEDYSPEQHTSSMARKMGFKEATMFLFLLLQTAGVCNSLPLSTNNRWIVDQKTGKRVKLACVNWASHLQPMIAEGLEKKPVKYIASQISSAGFNCVRLTWATYMVTRAEYSNLTVSQSLEKLGLKDAKAGVAKNNPQFLNMNVIEVQKEVVNELGRNNVMVVLDNHISQPQWCCHGSDGNGFFGDAYFDPDEWLKGLVGVASIYKGNRAVVAMSLRNELRGPRQDNLMWYQHMQEGAIAVNKQNPDVLVIVSGLNFDQHLGYLRSKPFVADIGNKLVFEAHWYTFGTSADAWKLQANVICGTMTEKGEGDYLFLIRGNHSYPLFLSEFGIDQRGINEADNRYLTCLLAAIVENDIDWALWAFQGSYMLREGGINTEEAYGIMDFDWARPKNSSFIQRLQIARQINQIEDPSHYASYKMFHPQTGLCAQVDKNNIFLSNCNSATRWFRHKDGGLLKLGGNPRKCLAAAGDGIAAQVSTDCTMSSSSSLWDIASKSQLHLAAQVAPGKYLCLEKNAADYTIVTKECICLAYVGGPKLVDITLTCDEDPRPQWFKLILSIE